MKLCTGLCVFLLLSLISSSLSQDYDDTRMVNADDWRDKDPETLKEVDKREDDIGGEEEVTKRSRPRNGSKRRRRLRKRPRTTEPPLEEAIDNLETAEQTPQEQYERARKLPEEEEGVTPPSEDPPKRRPGKRRRRPHRRYQETEPINEGEVEEAPKPPRRRRKGGRKRVKPEVIEEVPEFTTTVEGIQTIQENKAIETDDFYNRQNNFEHKYEESTTTPTTTTIKTTTITTTTTTSTEPPLYTEQASENSVFNKKPNRNEEDQSPTTRPSYLIRNRNSSKNKIIPIKSESETVTHEEKQDDKEFGNKIYERKDLFPKSRRLPETSAVLRRKLVPQTTAPEINHLRIINPLANFGSQLDNSVKQTSRNEVTMKPEQIEEYTQSPVTTESGIKIKSAFGSTTEEPNYPKFESRKRISSYRSEVTPTKTTTTTTTTATPSSTESKELEGHNFFENIVKDEDQEVLTSSIVPEIKAKPEIYTQLNVNLEEEENISSKEKRISEDSTMDGNMDPIEDEIQLNSSNNTNLNDSILELLKTEGTRLSRILELRNMTVEQLLEHRERGSSKFQWSQMFNDSKKEAKMKEPNPKYIETNQPEPKYIESTKPETSKEEIKTETSGEEIKFETSEEEIKSKIATDDKIFGEKENSKTEQIQFPEEEILGSFPKFISDKIAKHTQHQSQKPKEIKNQIKEHREPRVFDSMPEFQTPRSEALPKPHPTWRIIPNPKLLPVSVRGNFEEIKITDVLTSGKSGNDVKEIYLLDGKENFINHNNKFDDSLDDENVKNQYNTLSTFKKIPVSVRSAIIISAAILVLAIFGFLSVLISCRVRQKKARLRAKQDILCEHLQNEDFMNSQQSLNPVINKQQHQRGPVFSQGIHSNTASNRHYYLWRTLRKTFQYD